VARGCADLLMGICDDSPKLDLIVEKIHRRSSYDSEHGPCGVWFDNVHLSTRSMYSNAIQLVPSGVSYITNWFVLYYSGTLKALPTTTSFWSPDFWSHAQSPAAITQTAYGPACHVIVMSRDEFGSCSEVAGQHRAAH
jgi:hypothetical protein